MAYDKQTWDTTSYVNPTRMNHIEDGVYNASNEFLSKGTSTGDADAILTIGIYRSNEGGITNCPTNNGVLVVLPAFNPVLSTNKTCVQMFYASNGNVYSRITWSAGSISWTNWTQL